MTGMWQILYLHEAINEFRDKLSEFHIDEDFLTTVFLILESSKFSPKIKICFLELVAEKYENDIELLDSQIQSYNFLRSQRILGKSSFSKARGNCTTF
jgi:hypothetical protein